MVTNFSELIEGVAPNIHALPMTLEQFRELAGQKLGRRFDFRKAYKVCDFRPAFGRIFEDQIRGYEFWGHCDLDIIWGQIGDYVTPEVLDTHDVISSRPHAVSGHMTLFRTDSVLTQIFPKDEDYLKKLQFPRGLGLDEVLMTHAARPLVEAGQLRAFWPRELSNSANNESGALGRLVNEFRWKDGRVYRGPDPIMYLHFMGWTTTLKRCEVSLEDEPHEFWISFSQITREPRRTSLMSNVEWVRNRTARYLRLQLNRRVRAWVSRRS